MHFYVYILQSITTPDKHYVGYTTNIERRLDEHNAESQIYSKRYAPWKLVTYTVFTNEKTAKSFEKYLKTNSGMAVLKKRLI